MPTLEERLDFVEQALTNLYDARIQLSALTTTAVTIDGTSTAYRRIGEVNRDIYKLEREKDTLMGKNRIAVGLPETPDTRGVIG